MNSFLKVPLTAACLVATWSAVKVSAQIPTAPVGAPAQWVATLHAEGVQIYQCKPDSEKPPSEPRALTWQFREPVATLIADGKSVGRHYAGPNWDHIDGGGVKGRVANSAPGTTPNDIPWLKLDVIEHRGSGVLSEAGIVARVNTKGGVAQGPCESAGAYLSVPYSADYVFMRNKD